LAIEVFRKLDIAARNNVHHLRRVLGIERKSKEIGERMLVEATAAAMPAPQTLPALPIQEPRESLKQRIEAAITSEEAIQEKLLGEAQTHERRLQMLRALLPFADEPAIEESLRGVLRVIEPAVPPTPDPVPEPPQAIWDRLGRGGDVYQRWV
jgi:hypothetical protein